MPHWPLDCCGICQCVHNFFFQVCVLNLFIGMPNPSLLLLSSPWRVSSVNIRWGQIVLDNTDLNRATHRFSNTGSFVMYSYTDGEEVHLKNTSWWLIQKSNVWQYGHISPRFCCFIPNITQIEHCFSFLQQCKLLFLITTAAVHWCTRERWAHTAHWGAQTNLPKLYLVKLEPRANT